MSIESMLVLGDPDGGLRNSPPPPLLLPLPMLVGFDDGRYRPPLYINSAAVRWCMAGADRVLDAAGPPSSMA